MRERVCGRERDRERIFNWTFIPSSFLKSSLYHPLSPFLPLPLKLWRIPLRSLTSLNLKGLPPSSLLITCPFSYEILNSILIFSLSLPPLCCYLSIYLSIFFSWVSPEILHHIPYPFWCTLKHLPPHFPFSFPPPSFSITSFSSSLTKISTYSSYIFYLKPLPPPFLPHSFLLFLLLILKHPCPPFYSDNPIPVLPSS